MTRSTKAVNEAPGARSKDFELYRVDGNIARAAADDMAFPGLTDRTFTPVAPLSR